MARIKSLLSHVSIKLGIICLITVLSGCSSSDRGYVTGKILHTDGTPLVRARVIAHCAETGKTAYGTTDTDGFYELAFGAKENGIPPGIYVVYLIEDRGVVEGQMTRTIAKKYTDPNTSGLSFEVDAGENKVFDITADSP